MNNNCLYNAAYVGFIQGAIGGAWQQSATATDYLKLTQAAQAFAQEVDTLIPFDALITTNSASTMLVDTASNTIQSNTQFRPGLLQAIVQANFDGRYGLDATATDYSKIAATCAAIYTESILLFVSP